MKVHRFSVRVFAAIAGFTVLLVASCSTTPPEIAQTFWQVNLVHDRTSGGTHERLSFFVQVMNTDGVSDLGTIYLLNDKSELYWRLDPSNWEVSNRNGEFWVGSNSLQTPDGSAVPRGDYRVLVSNLAGERATTSIFVSSDRLNPTTTDFPTLSVRGGVVGIASALSQATVWLYNAGGQFVASRTVGAAGYPVSSIAPAAGRGAELTGYAYVYDKQCGCGLVNGPYPVSNVR